MWKQGPFIDVQLPRWTRGLNVVLLGKLLQRSLEVVAQLIEFLDTLRQPKQRLLFLRDDRLEKKVIKQMKGEK